MKNKSAGNKRIVLKKERLLEKYISEDTKTIPLMDEFEETNESGNKRYDWLIITNNYPYHDYIYELIVGRYKEGEGDVGGITLTQFKKMETYVLRRFVEAELEEQIGRSSIKQGMVVTFSKPFLLRAQNSKNKTGYGSIYHYGELIREGTKYGETTSYGFMGVRFK